MSVLEAIILGIFQGLTEFIPVSSSGHLVLLQEAFGVQQSGLAFDVALHFGTLLALLLYFRNDLVSLVRGVFTGGKNRTLALLLALATIPAAAFGFILEDAAESTFRSVRLVAFNLIIVAVLMLVAERYMQKKQKTTKLDNLKPKQALAVGFAQAAAIIPGVSRSGSTITVGLFAGLDRISATRFSFLLGIPIMIGAILKVFTDTEALSQVSNERSIFISGIIAAFVSGLLAITFLLKFLSKHSLNIFAYYRIAIGVIVLLISVL